MIWFVICGGIILAGASFGAGERIAPGEPWYVILPLGLLSIVITLAVLGGFFYGLWQVGVFQPE